MVHDLNVLIDNDTDSIELLKSGNKRFVENNLMVKDSYPEDRHDLSEGQKPFAVILCCSDSRVAPEIYFDQKLGDIFVIRNAGNIVNDTVLGSVEYAVEHLHTPLVVVVGHTECGAVGAACSGAEITGKTKSITDVIKQVITEGDSASDVVLKNAVAMKDEILKNDIVKENSTKVVSAVYDIETGLVSW